MVETSDDTGQRSGDGHVIWVPLDRVLSVRARYHRTDRVAGHRARVEADAALLGLVRQVTATATDHVEHLMHRGIRPHP